MEGENSDLSSMQFGDNVTLFRTDFFKRVKPYISTHTCIEMSVYEVA